MNVLHALTQNHKSDEAFDDDIGLLALNIKNEIQSLARVDWRTSVAINKKMRQAIEDFLWDFCDEHKMNIDLDTLDIR